MARSRLMKSFHEFVMTREEYMRARDQQKHVLTSAERKSINDTILTLKTNDETTHLWTSYVEKLDDNQKLLPV